MISLACKNQLIRYFGGMDDKWLDRFRSAVQKAIDNGASMRGISKAANLNPNYIDQMMNGSQPTVQKFLAICEALNENPIEILTGVPQNNPAILKALQIFASWPEDQQESFLEWIEKVPTPSAEKAQGTTTGQAAEHDS